MLSCDVAQEVGKCVDSLWHCIVALCTLRECRTATMTAPLLLTHGPVRYEAVLHSCGTNPVWGWVPTCDSAYS